MKLKPEAMMNISSSYYNFIEKYRKINMKLFKKLSLALTCFATSMSLIGCGTVDSVGSMAGYHKIGTPEVKINSEVYEKYEDLVEIKFYESKDDKIGDPIKVAKTFVRAGKDVIMTIGAIDTLALDGEITCDIKTVKLVEKTEKEDEPVTPDAPETSDGGTEAPVTSEEGTEAPETSEDKKSDAKPAKGSEETKEEEVEALPVIAKYVFEMPDSTPTFSFSFAGTVPHVHEFAKTWEATEEGHCHVCACGEKTAIEAHTFDEGTVTKEATEAEPGTKVYKCTVCGYEKTEEISYVPETTPEVPETSSSSTSAE